MKWNKKFLAATVVHETFRKHNKSSAVAEMGDRARAKWAEKWGTAVPLSIAGSPSNTMWPGLRPTSAPSGILIHSTDWPPTLQTDRQDNGAIAQGDCYM